MQRRKSGHEESWLMSYADLITNLLLFFVVLVTAANLSKSRMQQITKAMSGVEQQASLESIKKEIDAKIQAQRLQELVATKLQDDGLELSLNSGVVFDLGKAEIRTEFEPALNGMLQTLVPYSSKYTFAVEGHTDATQIMPGGPFATNWQLASERAIVVRGHLESLGVEPRRMRVEAYADTKPLPESELAGLSSVERDARLRRVVVRVY
ncbi:MAG: OmpA family protein [Deltaproteobacteria bacterium]|nr:OmpA family protein [Deltaproteobacteria bacterium]